MSGLLNLYAVSLEQLRDELVAWGEPPFRAKQVWRSLFERGVSSVASMTDLPAALRARLEEESAFGSLTSQREQESRDGTRKVLYRLHDGQHIETVLMPYRDGRQTVCVSTQAGCAMGCVFCATGQMGFVRHLRADEIFEQVARQSARLKPAGGRVSNVVFMGMGEPFHNYDAVLDTVRRLMGDLGIGARHITISTVGLVPQMLRFAGEGLQVGLAVSLHAADDNERSSMMPVNRRWPLNELFDACREVVERTGRRMTFEWASIAGKNDDPDTAHRLGRRLKDLHCHVNIIPLNPTSRFDGGPARRSAIDGFVTVLESYGVPTTLRVRRGIDIDAGCGQLKERVESEPT